MESAAERAQLSKGISNLAIYEMVERALSSRRIVSGTIVDVGCGEGNLYPVAGRHFERYFGVDIVRYPALPPEIQFVPCDLSAGSIPLPTGFANVVVSVETIEHLENPRGFMREVVRLAAPGGWVVVTTPNQLSLLSLLTLVVKQRFSAFQDVHYPAHLSALLEVDLVRIGRECGLSDLAIEYSVSGRIPGTAWRYAEVLSRLFPRLLSDNVLLIGRKPA